MESFTKMSLKLKLKTPRKTYSNSSRLDPRDNPLFHRTCVLVWCTCQLHNLSCLGRIYDSWVRRIGPCSRRGRRTASPLVCTSSGRTGSRWGTLKEIHMVFLCRSTIYFRVCSKRAIHRRGLGIHPRVFAVVFEIGDVFESIQIFCRGITHTGVKSQSP